MKEEGDETAAVFDARNDFSDGASEEEEVVEELSCLLRRNRKRQRQIWKLPGQSLPYL